MTELIIVIIKICMGLFLGILAGNGAVYVFNHIPASWLCDYGEDSRKVDHVNSDSGGSTSPKDPSDSSFNGRSYNYSAAHNAHSDPNDYIPQRIKSHPWKLTFSMVLCIAYIWLFTTNTFSFAAASCVAIWLLLLIAAADRKYMIIPDQFTALLAITAIGFISCHSSFLQPLWGALLGGGCMLAVGLTGKLIFKRESLGFGDVKLFAAIGLCLGLYGTAIVLLGTSLMSCIVYSVRILRKKISKGDMQPLADIIALVTGLYLIFYCYQISYLQFF